MKLLLNNILLSIILLIVIACGSEPESQNKEPEPEQAQAQIKLNSEPAEISTYVDTTPTYDYSSWKTVYYQNIKIIYPEDHIFADKMQETAQIYKTILRRSSQVFGLTEPTDSIVMFYYTGFGQGQTLANAEFPTTRGDTIFFWSGNKIGVTAAMHALKRWTKVKSNFYFLDHGIFRLLDATGRNYHVMTLSYIDSSEFKSLKDLIIDERINYHADTYKTAELASFIDYFIYKFGIGSFKLLYESQLAFEPTIQIICKMDLNALEKDWIQIIKQANQKKTK